MKRILRRLAESEDRLPKGLAIGVDRLPGYWRVEFHGTFIGMIRVERAANRQWNIWHGRTPAPESKEISGATKEAIALSLLRRWKKRDRPHGTSKDTKRMMRGEARYTGPIPGPGWKKAKGIHLRPVGGRNENEHVFLDGDNIGTVGPSKKGGYLAALPYPSSRVPEFPTKQEAIDALVKAAKPGPKRPHGTSKDTKRMMRGEQREKKILRRLVEKLTPKGGEALPLEQFTLEYSSSHTFSLRYVNKEGVRIWVANISKSKKRKGMWNYASISTEVFGVDGRNASTLYLDLADVMGVPWPGDIWDKNFRSAESAKKFFLKKARPYMDRNRVDPEEFNRRSGKPHGTSKDTKRMMRGEQREKGIIRKLYEVWGNTQREEDFVKGYLQKYPGMKTLFSPSRVETVATSQRATEDASYTIWNGKRAITLSPGFWRMDATLQYAIFTHELGHAVASYVGSWIDVAKEKFGIDVWALKPLTMDMPFQSHNWEEAFAETFSVVATRDSRGMGLLKKHWPAWIDLVTWAGSRLRVF